MIIMFTFPAIVLYRSACNTYDSDSSFLYLLSHVTLAGITGVKVDCQAGVGLIGSALGGGPALAQQYHIALEDSIKQHFPSNDCINCMCHSTENFYRQVDVAAAASEVLSWKCNLCMLVLVPDWQHLRANTSLCAC